MEPDRRNGTRMLESFDEEAWAVLRRGEQIAARQNQPVHSGHVLMALLENQSHMMAPVLEYYNITYQGLHEEIATLSTLDNRLNQVASEAGATYMTPNMARVVSAAYTSSLFVGKEFVTPMHIFLGLLATKGTLGSLLLEKLGVDMQLARCMLIAQIHGFKGGMAEFLDAASASYRWVAEREEEYMRRGW